MTGDSRKFGVRLSEGMRDRLCAAIGRGGKDVDIASDFSVSESTVAYYRSKLGISKRAGFKAPNPSSATSARVCIRGGCFNKPPKGARVCDNCKSRASSRYTDDQKRHMMAGRA